MGHGAKVNAIQLSIRGGSLTEQYCAMLGPSLIVMGPNVSCRCMAERIPIPELQKKLKGGKLVLADVREASEIKRWLTSKNEWPSFQRTPRSFFIEAEAGARRALLTH